MKQNNTLVQNIVNGLHGDLEEFFVINNGKIILTQKNAMLKQHFEQLNFVMQASLNLYELIEILNLMRFSVQFQAFTNIAEIKYFDDSYKNEYIKQNTKVAEFFVQKYSKFPNLPNTKGIQMLIFVLENYIRYYHETINAIIEDIINNYKQLYNGLQNLDYKLIDDSNDPFIGFLTQQLQIADIKHFQFVAFVKDFYEIYLIKIINQPLSIQKEEYQVSEAVLNKQKQIIHDTIKNMSTFPFVLNHSQAYKQQLLPTMQLYFHEHIHGHLIAKYYKNMVFPYLLQSFISDFQREFFIQSKVSVLNAQSQLQNNPFEGFNQIQNYNETLIIKNLFPYFVCEQLAREMVVCVRMVLHLRENNIQINVDPIQAFQGDQNPQDSLVLQENPENFVTSEFEFHSSFQRYNQAIQAIYIENVQKSDLRLEILQILQFATIQMLSKQLDDAFTQFGQKLKSAQKLGSDTIEVDNEGVGSEYILQQGLGQKLRDHQLKLNGVGLRRRVVPRDSQNELLYDLNDCFVCAGRPPLLHYQRGIERVQADYGAFKILDLESEFYQIELVREVYNVMWYHPSGGRNVDKAGNGANEVLINNLLLGVQARNGLVLQSPVLGGLSKVFRQLLVLRFAHFDCMQEMEAARQAEMKLRHFELNGRKRLYHFNTGATALIKAGRRFQALKASLLQLWVKVAFLVQSGISAVCANFKKNLNINSYAGLKSQLAMLISELFLASGLTKVRFYTFIIQLQRVTKQLCTLAGNLAAAVQEGADERSGYGALEGPGIRQLHSALDQLTGQVTELAAAGLKAF